VVFNYCFSTISNLCPDFSNKTLLFCPDFSNKNPIFAPTFLINHYFFAPTFLNMYYNRLIDKCLEEWKKDPFRKPLILRGARQVGKSSAVRQLARTFDDFVEINFEQNPQVKSVFMADLSPDKIIEQLSVWIGRQIIPGKTLLFLDEIQACPQAISSLRFFYEQLPSLHLIAAGSLLEFALQSLPSFGVGRIRSYYMFPFSFDEFLAALGEDLLLSTKQKASIENPLSTVLHDKLINYVSLFMITGGMPEAISRYVQTRQLLQVQSVLDDISNSLRSDFAKYKHTVPSLRLQEVFNAVVHQAGGKFMYSKAAEQSKEYQVKEALELLILAGWVLPVIHSAANGIPIGAEIDTKKRKMVLLDTGIFQRILGLDLASIYTQPNFVFINKGVLAEHFWGLEYIKYQQPDTYPELYYWHREGKSNAEVDFVVQHGGTIFPVEIKSSGKGQMQSIRTFIQEKNTPFGYRFSTENFATYENIKVFPLYAVASFVKNGGF
jgi:uncharacterized protein